MAASKDEKMPESQSYSLTLPYLQKDSSKLEKLLPNRRISVFRHHCVRQTLLTKARTTVRVLWSSARNMYSPALCAAIFIYLSIQYSLCKLVFLVNKTDESKLDNYPEMSTQQQNLVDEVESSFQVNFTLTFCDICLFQSKVKTQLFHKLPPSHMPLPQYTYMRTYVFISGNNGP